MTTFSMFCTLAAAAIIIFANAEAQSIGGGNFDVEHQTIVIPTLDSTNRVADVWYPTEGNAHGLIVFAHGFRDGNEWVFKSFDGILREVASHGFVVVGPQSCNLGCRDHSGTLFGDPPGFKYFYEEQLKTIEWARNATGDPVFSRIDFSKGVGVSGHSMGGQATLFSASEGRAEEHGIVAAAMLHAYTHTYPEPTVPFLAMTGSHDAVASSSMSEKFYANATGVTKAYAEKKDLDHSSIKREGLAAQFIVSWMKLHLIGERVSDDGIDWESIVFGDDVNSLCGGGYGTMSQCEFERP